MAIYVGDKRYALLVGSTRRKAVVPSSLPYDAEIEYLESTGTQWIDTGFRAEGGAVTEYECTLKMFGEWFVGSHNPSTDRSNGYNRFCFIPYRSDTVQFNKCSYFGTIRYYSLELNVPYVIFFDAVGYNRIGRINNTVVINQQTTQMLHPVNNIVCFLAQYENRVNPGILHWLKIQDSNYELVRDYIPVRVGQVGYLYDKVSGQLFGNQGTGDFVLGPDKT